MRVSMNPDKEKAKELAKKIKENSGYCLCALVKDPTTKCMCKEFADMVESGYVGPCHCGFYYSYKT